MTVNAITPTQAAAPKPPTTTVSPASNTALDRQAFLKLLVAQLRYQDPSKPMDASQMISQSAQLSVVDKLDEISRTLSGSTFNDQMILGGSLIGKAVTFASSDGTSVTQTVTSARLVNGSMVLSAGEWDVPLAAVTGIGQPAAATTTTAGTATGTTAGTTAGTATGTTAGTSPSAPATTAAAAAAATAATAATDASTVSTAASPADTPPAPTDPAMVDPVSVVPAAADPGADPALTDPSLGDSAAANQLLASGL